jgi:hypothetical protein
MVDELARRADSHAMGGESDDERAAGAGRHAGAHPALAGKLSREVVLAGARTREDEA